jgi:hypothetical protein
LQSGCQERKIDAHHLAGSFTAGDTFLMTIRGFIAETLCGATALAILASAREATAGWPPNGIAVGSTGTVQEQGAGLVAPDGLGGLFVMWREERINSLTGHDVYLQHVLPGGVIDSRWPISGLPIVTQPDFQAPGLLIADQSGGALLMWIDYRSGHSDIYAQRVGADAQLVAGWTPQGTPVCAAPGDQEPESLCPDGTGGAYFAWDDYRDGTERGYLTHLSPNGSVAPGWPINGKRVTEVATVSGAICLVEESDGCLAVWTDLRGKTSLGVNMFATRLTVAGDLYPGWPSEGMSVLGSGTVQEVRAAVSDGAGGAFVGWDDNRGGISPSNPFYYDLYAQHVAATGIVDSRWPANGLAVCNAPGAQYNFDLAPDGHGGALFVWEDSRSGVFQMYGQRILADANAAPGWTPNGDLLATSGISKFQPNVVGDGLGGAYAAWVQYPASGSNTIFGQHVTADGTLDPMWGHDGLPLAVPAQGSCDNPSLAQDGFGGAVMAYQRSDNEPYVRIYALRIQADGPVPTLLSLADFDVQDDQVTIRWQCADAAGVSATVERSGVGSEWTTLGIPRAVGMQLLVYQDQAVSPGTYAYRLRYSIGGKEETSAPVSITVTSETKLALEGFRPNPAIERAVISFALPDARSAVLEVYDVRGRLVFSQQVGPLGPGKHMVQLDGVAKLGSGMYWLRLIRSDQTLSAKGMVVR